MTADMMPVPVTLLPPERLEEGSAITLAEQRYIDAVNKNCYDAIAHEYEDASHATCRDFDTANKIALSRVSACFPAVREPTETTSFRLIEIGSGTGHLLPSILEALPSGTPSVVLMDISERMVAISRQRYGGPSFNHFCVSLSNASTLGIAPADFIFGLLCDPYLTPQSLADLRNLATPGCFIVLTFPSAKWADATRRGELRSPHAVFRDRSGYSHVSYSFCWHAATVRDHSRSAGFDIVYEDEITFSEVVPCGDRNQDIQRVLGGSAPMLSVFVLRPANVIRPNIPTAESRQCTISAHQHSSILSSYLFCR